MRPEGLMTRVWGSTMHKEGQEEHSVTSKRIRRATEKCEMRPERKEPEVLREGTS